MGYVIKFESWLEQKYLQWQFAREKRGNIREFSEWLGVDQKLVARWMSGDRRPGQDKAKLLALKFGLEVYDVLGLPRPDPELFRIEAVWDSLPESERVRLANLAEEYADHAAKDGRKRKGAALKEAST